MNCRGDEDIDAKRSRPSIGKPVMGHARKERVVLFGTDQRITSGPAAKRPHSKAEYMTAPERFADSQIPLAPRAPSIHDPISKQGDRYLRRILVVGAHSVLRRAKQNPEKYLWLTQLLARRPFKVVAVALANKMARMAWALLAHGGTYRAPVLAAAA